MTMQPPIRSLSHRRRVQAPPAATTPDWWDPNSESLSVVAAYLFKSAASEAASLVNLANPGTYDISKYGSPTWSSAGWAGFNASNFLICTGLVPGNNWSLFAQYTGCTANNTAAVAGSRKTGDDAMVLWQRRDGGANRGYSYGNSITVAPPATSGNMAIAGTAAYLNGAAEAGSLTATTTTANPITIGQCASYPVSGTVIAVAVYNAALTADQALAVATAMAAL